jgi:DNA modification methylase
VAPLSTTTTTSPRPTAPGPTAPGPTAPGPTAPGPRNVVLTGDALATLRTIPGDSAQCCVTSPPYWGLRDYGIAGQVGREQTPGEYAAHLVDVFREVRRVLTKSGTLWVNLGDSYTPGKKRSRSSDEKNPAHASDDRAQTTLKPKDLVGIPWLVASALRSDGWYLRCDVIWHKPNVMPESVTDRPTRAHEYLFLLSRSERYYYDHAAVRERAVGKTVHDLTGQGYHPPGQAPSSGNRKALPGPTYHRHRSSVPGGQDLRRTVDGKRNLRSVWTVPTSPYHGAHFATFPAALIEPCVLAGSKPGDLVLDPFAGSGTTCALARALGRDFLGIKLNPDYVRLSNERLGHQEKEESP